MPYSEIDLSKNPSLKTLVYENLLSQIMSGQLSPGTRLMESEISHAMNVSRAPIREAFNMLERDGFTRIIPNKGSIVSEVTMENVLEVWEARKLIEPYSAKVSYKYATKNEVLTIYRNLNKLENQKKINIEDFTQSDTEVHNLLRKYLPNKYLKSILENVCAHSMRMQWYTQNTIEDQWAVSIKEHKKIINAIIEENPEAISKEVYEHLVSSEDRILRNMSR